MKGYVHIGADTVLNREEIVGIFDLDNTSWSYLTREFLARAEKEGRVVNTAEDLPRSFVLCGGRRVILIQPSAAAIVRRLDQSGRTYG